MITGRVAEVVEQLLQVLIPLRMALKLLALPQVQAQLRVVAKAEMVGQLVGSQQASPAI
jgi:hypothetical protein